MMGLAREPLIKRTRPQAILDTPGWLRKADGLANRLFITRAEKELLDLVRLYGDLAKADLVALSDYSRTKVTACVTSLLKKKYLVINSGTEYSGGRRSRTYSINPGLGLVAGVDIGATSIDLAVADLSKKILARYSEPAQVREGPINILGRVCTMLEKIILEQGLDVNKVIGIGIGIPGPVDFSLGTVVSPPIMPGWDKYPIIQTVQQWFPSANVVVDNDVNVMALGEIQEGIGRGVNDLIFVKIGTGIGAGIICGGKIYRGASGCAGDIGHISVIKDGPLCHCGNRGCLESMAGGPAIAERALALAEEKNSILTQRFIENNERLTAEDVGRAAREGDPLSIQIIRDSGQMVGDVLASLVNFYNPEMMVIGGGVSNLGDLLLSSIRQAVLVRSTPLATRNLHIVFSGMSADAGITGAVNLALEYIFTVESSGSNGN
jgi:glucokinase-like ROK family protein